MATIDQVDRKVDEILRQLGALNSKTVGAGPAYERPAILEADAVADSQTVNTDGSIWAMSRGFVSPASQAANPARKVMIAYGYISPKKCPRLWELAEKVLGPEQFAAWNADWQAHPYGIYSDNPADTQPDTPMEELVKLVNFVMFDFRVKRLREHVQ